MVYNVPKVLDPRINCAKPMPRVIKSRQSALDNRSMGQFCDFRIATYGNDYPLLENEKWDLSNSQKHSKNSTADAEEQ